MDVAARLFEAQGFEGTAVSAILREAGVNSGSLYHFFPSKEGLLVSVLEQHLAALHSLLTDAARAADDPIERVFALLELYRGRLVVSGFTRGCPVGDLALELGSRHPEARAIIDDYFAAWTAGVAEWLHAAGERLPPDVDRSALARHTLSVMQGAVMQARAAAAIEPYDASVAQLRSLLELLGAGGNGERRAARRGAGDGGVRRVPAREAVTEEVAAAGGSDAARSHETTVAAEGPEWWRAW